MKRTVDGVTDGRIIEGIWKGKATMKELFDLFVTFAKIGGFTFGGGYAMLPILQREVVEKRGWATEEELMDYYAIGQCTPGIIAVNTATFIGYKFKGIIGGIVATLGCIAPSIVIITIITACLQNFASYPVVQHALSGIRICVCALIIQAIIKLGKKSIVDYPTATIALAVLLLSLFTKVTAVILVIGAAILGIIFQLIMNKNKLKEDE